MKYFLMMIYSKNMSSLEICLSAIETTQIELFYKNSAYKKVFCRVSFYHNIAPSSVLLLRFVL